MTLNFRRLAAPLALLPLLAGCPSESSDPPKPPAISLSATSLAFDATMAGATAPAAKTVTITNSGEGTLAKPTAAVDFGAGPTGWLAVAISGDAVPYTLTVTPSTAVAAGDHTATISIASAGASNTPETVTVDFTVSANTEPVIAVSSSALTFRADVGDGNPPAQIISVSNGGGGVLADPTDGPVVYAEGMGWLDVVVSGTDVTVTALTGLLTRGRYTATFTILSAGAYNTPVTVPVTFDVGEPALAVSPGSLAFATTVGTSASKTVSVSNSADGDLELPTVSSDRAWLGATVSGDSAPFTVTVTVDESLDAGSYSGSLTIDSPNASNGPLVVPVSVSVRAGKVSCYSAANSVCHEISTTLATNAASFSESCTLGGDTLSCPPTTLGPCTGLPGMTGPEYTASVWFYAPEFSAATAQLFCTVAEGTWDGPVDGGSTHFVSFGCNVPADLTCVDVSGTMTQATEDEWKTLCTDPGMGGGTIVTSCSTSNRIGTCSYTQSNVNLKERYYSGSGATAGDCSGTWTPG